MYKLISVHNKPLYFNPNKNDFVYSNDLIPNMLNQSIEDLRPSIWTEEEESSLIEQNFWLEKNVPIIRQSKINLDKAIKTNLPVTDKRKLIEYHRKNLETLSERLRMLCESAAWMTKQGLNDNAIPLFVLGIELVEEFLPRNVLAITYKCDYGSLLINTDSHEKGAVLLEGAIKYDRENGNLERLSITTYRLSEYKYNTGDLKSAKELIRESKEIRQKLFSSDSVQLESIVLAETLWFLLEEKYELIKSNLKPIYDRRKKENVNNIRLIPVIKILKEVAINEKNYVEQFQYMYELKNLNTMHFGELDFRTILINLQILNSFQTRAPQDDFEIYLFKIEDHLDKSNITKESAIVGYCYAELADAKYARQFFSTNLSVEEKKEIISESFRLVLKAKNHLTHTKALDKHYAIKLVELEETCLGAISFFSNVSHYNDQGMLVFIDQKKEAEIKEATPSIHEIENELAALSEFSSEVDYAAIEPNNRPFTAAEYHDLPSSGVVNPFRLRVAQGGLSICFSNGISIDELKMKLIEDADFYKKVKPIEIGIFENKIFSFDTRRLVVHMMAKAENEKVLIRYKKIKGDYLEERIQTILNSRPWNGLVTAIRFGGKNSATKPFICPPFQDQLNDKVINEFRGFPSQRKNSDSNGFLLKKAAAKKIKAFLINKMEKGSKTAINLLNTAESISHELGFSEKNKYFIKLKSDLKRPK
jgi:hypothetical protein